MTKTNRIRIGASLKVRSEKTTLEFIEWLHEIGLKHIEIKRDHDFIYPLTIDNVRKLRKHCDMTLEYHAPYRDFNLSSVNPKTQINCVNQIEEIIGLVHELEGDYVNTHLGKIPDYYPEPMKVKARESCVKPLQSCVNSAHDVGVKLCIENDPAKPNLLQFGKEADNLFEMINEIGEDVGITLDVGHANTSETTIFEFIKIFKDIIWVIHLNDNDGIMDSHLPIGIGNINFKEVLIALKDITNKDFAFLFEMARYEHIYESKCALEKSIGAVLVVP